jgi:hypothetical protein
LGVFGAALGFDLVDGVKAGLAGGDAWRGVGDNVLDLALHHVQELGVSAIVIKAGVLRYVQSRPHLGFG